MFDSYVEPSACDTYTFVSLKHRKEQQLTESLCASGNRPLSESLNTQPVIMYHTGEVRENGYQKRTKCLHRSTGCVSTMLVNLFHSVAKGPRVVARHHFNTLMSKLQEGIEAVCKAVQHFCPVQS